MQTGHEKTLTALMAALAGTNLIYGLGMIESGVTFDYAQLVIDNEMARMIKQVVGGVRVDDESLAVDDIAAVGSFGDFLSLDATMRHMRDTSQPELIDRRVREDWEARGHRHVRPRAMEKARHLLANHQPEPLPDDVLKQIRGIVDKADRERAPADERQAAPGSVGRLEELAAHEFVRKPSLPLAASRGKQVPEIVELGVAQPDPGDEAQVGHVVLLRQRETAFLIRRCGFVEVVADGGQIERHLQQHRAYPASLARMDQSVELGQPTWIARQKGVVVVLHPAAHEAALPGSGEARPRVVVVLIPGTGEIPSDRVPR